METYESCDGFFVARNKCEGDIDYLYAFETDADRAYFLSLWDQNRNEEALYWWGSTGAEGESA